MARPTFSMPDELLEEFDDKIFELKAEGKLDRDFTRSELVRGLIREWIEERTDVPPPEPEA